MGRLTLYNALIESLKEMNITIIEVEKFNRENVTRVKLPYCVVTLSSGSIIHDTISYDKNQLSVNIRLYERNVERLLNKVQDIQEAMQKAEDDCKWVFEDITEIYQQIDENMGHLEVAEIEITIREV